MPKLEQWADCGQCLYGLVYGHPTYEDGQEIYTDAIVVLDLEAGTVLTKDDITYELGRRRNGP